MDITLIQSKLYWENKEQNVAHFEQLINGIEEHTDLIILPEMFATGFTMNASTYAEKMNGKVIDWMKKTSSKKKASLCGSLIIEDDNKYYNRFIFIEPNGNIHHYDKRHLFRMGEENDHYSRGNGRIIIEQNGFKIFPVVCYDLRFPVWLRRTKEFDYDLMIVVANWPERRNLAWKNLLQARAIENQTYVAGVNRVGEDGSVMYHSGDTTLIDPKGEIICQTAHDAFVKTFTINKTMLDEWRGSFPVIEDADYFQIG